MTTERDMLDALNRRYSYFNGNGFRYARAEHVKLAPGFSTPGAGMRICDYMAMDLWAGQSTRPGPYLHGHEVKCSRDDWLTELKDPDKAEAFARYCDYWWLVLADKRIIRPEELPRGWGVMYLDPKRNLRAARRAIRRNPEPMPRTLQATIMRGVTKTASRLTLEQDPAINYNLRRQGILA